MKSLAGKVVVITGAGSGIGRALAKACAQQGALLALSDVDDDGLAQTAEQITGTRVRTDHLDVSDRRAVAAYAELVAEDFGVVNVVVNNAGVALTGTWSEVSYDDLDWLIGVNFWGVVHGTKEFLPHVIASGDGHIVNISSLFGLLAIPTQGAYNSAKFAVRGLTESLRMEMIEAGLPVGVTSVHPGGVKTSIARNARAAGGRDQEALAALFDTKLAKTSPERAATDIIDGILRNRPRVLVGPDAKLLDVFVRLLGGRYVGIVARMSRRSMRPANVELTAKR